jgi:hypothetical protein
MKQKFRSPHRNFSAHIQRRIPVLLVLRQRKDPIDWQNNFHSRAFYYSGGWNDLKRVMDCTIEPPEADPDLIEVL